MVMIKIGVSGARGKMGQRIIALAEENKQLQVIFGLEQSGHIDIGKAIDGIKITDQHDIIETCDCLIDFSLASAVTDNLKSALKFNKAMVIGITGLSPEIDREVAKAAESIAIVFSPNMSVGVNLLFKLLEEAAKTLKGYEVAISESHHIHKKDSPSGTAKKIVEIINREGFKIEDAEINARRQGDVVGDHKIAFESEVDTIELTHSAKTRDIFAQGALRAAAWVVGRPAGLYSMQDVLFGD